MQASPGNARKLQKGAATRSRMLDVAVREAALRGASNVSLADIAELAAVSKSSVAKHFGSKAALIQAIVDRATTQFLDFIWHTTSDKGGGRARIEAMLSQWRRWEDEVWDGGGCPVRALSIELNGQDGPARDLLRERLGLFRDLVCAELQCLRSPPLSAHEARQMFFEIRGLFLGYGEARRMMADPEAEAGLMRALDDLLARSSTPSTRVPSA